MLTKRVLITGICNAQTARHVAYALELGAQVMLVSTESVYAGDAPAGYSFFQAGQFAKARPDEGGYSQRVREEAKPFAAAVQAFAPDLCHVLGLGHNFLLTLAARLHPLLVSPYGYLDQWLYDPNKPLAKDELLLHADGVWVEPPVLVEPARRLLAEPAPALRVEEFAIGLDGRIFRAAEASKRAMWRRALQLPAQATVILSPRGWSSLYQHELILEAFAQALPHLPAPAYLLFVRLGRTWDVNEAEACMEQVKARALQLGVAEQIRWLPRFPATTIVTLYNSVDLIVSACVPDSFPHSLLEALACERPVIAPDLPTFAGSVLAEHCRLVPPLDRDALAAALVEGIHAPPSAEALAAAAGAVLARYDKPAVMARLATLYDAWR